MHTSVPGVAFSRTSTKQLTGNQFYTGPQPQTLWTENGLTAVLTYNANQLNTVATITISGPQPDSNNTYDTVATGLTTNSAQTFNYSLTASGGGTGAEHVGTPFPSGSQWGSWSVSLSIPAPGFDIPSITFGTNNNSFSRNPDEVVGGVTVSVPLSTTTGTVPGGVGGSYNLSGAWVFDGPGDVSLTGGTSTPFLTAPFGFLGTNTATTVGTTFHFS